MNNRVDDVLTKMKALKDQIKQMSEDQCQVIDILKTIAEKQVRYSKNSYICCDHSNICKVDRKVRSNFQVGTITIKFLKCMFKRSVVYLGSNCRTFLS